MNRRTLVRGVLVLASLLLVALEVPPADATSYVPVSGAGSTWSQVAIDAWRADVRANGVVVNYAGTGSTDGRSQYIQGTVDFADSEIPFENPPEPGQQPEVPSRPYAYMPIVAGGTSFMYNLTIAGKRVRDMRLSGETLAKIFTGQISNWDDKEITHEYGHQLPSIPIIPVVRADGAGVSAQFTRYMAAMYPSIYCPFIRSKLHLSGNTCPSVSFYPQFGNSKAQVGSNGVANYVSASYSQGAIGFDEYAYAKRINFPVVSLQNAAGYYTQPTAGDVAVSLTKATLNSDLTQNLTGVYRNTDPRTYELSSYSYMIVPTSTAAPFNAAKGKTLSTFINYFLCTGQQKAAILGYSPLPKNLVLDGFAQVKRIPGYVAPPSIGSCHNPALQILRTAPMPSKCQKQGASCVSAGTTAATTASSSSGSGTSGSGSSGGSSVTGAGSGAGTASPSGGGVDGSTGATAGDGVASATPVDLASAHSSGETTALYWLAGLALLLAVVLPPVLVARLGRRPPTR